MPKGAIYLYYKRGRVGDRLHNSERLDEMDNPKAAVKEFVKLFQQLTGNEFEPWEREKKIEKKRNKFYPIDMVYKKRKNALKTVAFLVSFKQPNICNLMSLRQTCFDRYRRVFF